MLFTNNFLIFLFLLPIIGLLILSVIKENSKLKLQIFTFNISCIIYLFSLLLWFFFDNSTGTFQYTTKSLWISMFNLNFVLGVDGISLFFILLTTLLIPLCLLISWKSVNINLKEFFLSFILLESFLIGVFCILDLLLFYIFFESVLIPMFIMVSVWGSRARKIRASYMLFFFTLLGSIIMLLAMLKLYIECGTLL